MAGQELGGRDRCFCFQHSVALSSGNGPNQGAGGHRTPGRAPTVLQVNSDGGSLRDMKQTKYQNTNQTRE